MLEIRRFRRPNANRRARLKFIAPVASLAALLVAVGLAGVVVVVVAFFFTSPPCCCCFCCPVLAIKMSTRWRWWRASSPRAAGISKFALFRITEKVFYCFVVVFFTLNYVFVFYQKFFFSFGNQRVLFRSMTRDTKGSFSILFICLCGCVCVCVTVARN